MNLIRQLYNLNRDNYKLLRKKFSKEVLLETRKYFMMGKTMQPVTSYMMCHYIDNHGNFLERGKCIHHHIARAIYESMGSTDKVGILEYLEEEDEVVE